MDLRGTHYNTNAQVRDLEQLVRQLPKPIAGSQPVTPPRARPRTAKQLNAEQRAQLIAGYEAGAELRELGKLFGIHPDTVGLTLRREGVAQRSRSMTPEQVAEASRLYGDAWSSARIGRRLGFNATTVVTMLRKHGVRIRDANGQHR